MFVPACASLDELKENSAKLNAEVQHLNSALQDAQLKQMQTQSLLDSARASGDPARVAQLEMLISSQNQAIGRLQSQSQLAADAAAAANEGVQKAESQGDAWGAIITAVATGVAPLLGPWGIPLLIGSNVATGLLTKRKKDGQMDTLVENVDKATMGKTRDDQLVIDSELLKNLNVATGVQKLIQPALDAIPETPVTFNIPTPITT